MKFFPINKKASKGDWVRIDDDSTLHYRYQGGGLIVKVDGVESFEELRLEMPDGQPQWLFRESVTVGCFIEEE